MVDARAMCRARRPPARVQGLFHESRLEEFCCRARRGRIRRAGAMTRVHVGAIDQGTTSTRFVLYAASDAADPSSYVAVASHQMEHAQIRPRPGWCEHDAEEIARNAATCARETLRKANVRASEVACVGIANQRETTVAWSRSSGTPATRAQVWLDARTSELCERMAETTCGGDRMKFASTCGLPVSTYFSAVKMRWMLENDARVRELADSGDLCFGTIESWLVYKLTGGKVHATDASNASRTMLMRLDDLTWDAATCEAFGVPTNALPEIKSCAEYFGEIDGDAFEGVGGIKITGCIGDQQSATLGQRCDVGEAKNTYGTGCFMLLNTGSSIVHSKHGLLSTLAWQLGGKDATPKYALEGSVAIGGAVVHWLRDNLGLITQASDVEGLANTVEDAAGVSFVPAFNGLFAPRWREDARGVIVGLTQYVNKGHIARAALDAIAFQSRDVLEAMRQDMASSTNHELRVLKVDGGASANNLLMQTQADCIGLTVLRPTDIETTARGAAYAAAVGAGLMTESDVFRDKNGSDGASKEFVPNISDEARAANYARWNDAVQRTLNMSSVSP